MEEQMEMINQIRDHREEPERSLPIQLEKTEQALAELTAKQESPKSQKIVKLEKQEEMISQEAKFEQITLVRPNFL
jgi:hypothetical protein